MTALFLEKNRSMTQSNRPRMVATPEFLEKEGISSRKMSDTLLDFVAPFGPEALGDRTIEEIEHWFITPVTVWNAVVLSETDNNPGLLAEARSLVALGGHAGVLLIFDALVERKRAVFGDMTTGCSAATGRFEARWFHPPGSRGSLGRAAKVSKRRQVITPPAPRPTAPAAHPRPASAARSAACAR